jgi:hypothetical protein
MDYRIYSDYKIYSDGTIINKYGKTMSKRARDGRYEVRLHVDGKRRNFILSRLMYWLFVDKFDINNKNLCVAVKDGNFLNVDPDNLYLTERKNLIQGEGHKRIVKITDEQTEEIRAAYKGNKIHSNQYTKTGVSLEELADKYNVTKKNIHHIIIGTARNKDEYKLK